MLANAAFSAKRTLETKIRRDASPESTGDPKARIERQEESPFGFREGSEGAEGRGGGSLRDPILRKDGGDKSEKRSRFHVLSTETDKNMTCYHEL